MSKLKSKRYDSQHKCPYPSSDKKRYNEWYYIHVAKPKHEKSKEEKSDA